MKNRKIYQQHTREAGWITRADLRHSCRCQHHHHCCCHHHGASFCYHYHCCCLCRHYSHNYVNILSSFLPLWSHTRNSHHLLFVCIQYCIGIRIHILLSCLYNLPSFCRITLSFCCILFDNNFNLLCIVSALLSS